MSGALKRRSDCPANSPRVFTVEGRDLTMMLPVAPWELVLGAGSLGADLGRRGEARHPSAESRGSQTASDSGAGALIISVFGSRNGQAPGVQIVK